MCLRGHEHRRIGDTISKLGKCISGTGCDDQNVKSAPGPMGSASGIVVIGFFARDLPRRVLENPRTCQKRLSVEAA